MNKINKNGKIMFKISCREMKFDLFWCLTFISNLHLRTFSLKATAKIGIVLITNNACRGKWPKATRHVSCSIKSLPMPGIRDLFLVRRARGQLMTQC